MSYTAQNIIDEALILLEDSGQLRFTDEMLLTFINEAMTNIVTLKPTANVVYSVKSLLDGVYQPLAANELYLLDIVYNTNSDGSLQGSSPRRVKKATLDFSNTDWTASTHADEVMYYMYDSDGTRVFFVYPPNTGDGYVYSKTTNIPTRLTSASESIVLREEYRLPLIYYVCAKAFMVDSDTANTDKVNMYMSMYTNSISTVKTADAQEDAKNAG